MSKHEQEIQSMLKAMSKKGWRITEQRRRLAELFASTTGYLSPKDVYEHMREEYPGVSFDTVYRNLRLLQEMGVLEQFYFQESGLKFKMNCLSHHHHHLICVNCERTVTFEFCPMAQVSDLPGDFEIVNHRFEIFGVCGDCKKELTT